RGDPRNVGGGAHVVSAGAFVAGRRGDVDAGGAGVEEADGVDVRPRRRGGVAADRGVDDVDLVGDRLVDGGGDRGHRAAGGGAHVVGDVVRVQRDTLDVAGGAELVVGAERAVGGSVDLVARAGARRVRPVTVVVVRASRLADGEAPRADQLVVAAEVGHVDVGVGRIADPDVVTGAQRVGVVVAVAAVGLGDGVGEGRVGRVDPAVEDADDDAFALRGALLAAGCARAVPEGGRADPLGSVVGLEFALLVDLDGDDAGEVGHGARFVAGQGHRDAVDGVGVGVHDLGGAAGLVADRGDQVGLGRFEVVAVGAHGRGVGVEAVGPAGLGRGGGDVVDAALVRRYGRVGELDDVQLGLVGGAAEGHDRCLVGTVRGDVGDF